MMALHTIWLTIPATRQVRTEHPNGAVSITSEPNGTKRAQVEVSIDVAGIAKELGAKAIRSKGKKAGAMGGLVRVKVVSPITHEGGV